MAASLLREQLLPRWRTTHLGWGPELPRPLSRFMCRYTSELVALLDPRWQVTLGLVDGHTHTWTERTATSCCGGSLFLDLTADQFGRAEVLLGPRRPDGYIAHVWTDSDPGPYRARAQTWLAGLV